MGEPHTTLNRARASFLGVAVGDALGATTEFLSPEEVRAKYGVHRKMVGGGWLYLKPGQVTDDTQMSLCVARALVAKGRWDLTAIADGFAAWLRGNPVDVGATCARGIRRYLHTGKLAVPPSEWDAGNGAVMRMAPTALFTLGDAELLDRYSAEQAHLTHNHPLSDAACRCVGRMVHDALLHGDAHRLHALARDLVQRHPLFEFRNYDGGCSPFVVDTLRTVFHYLFTTGSFEECLVGVVNEGGDADTAGAIAGMLAGALYGPAALPPRWVKRLLPRVRAETQELAARLVQLSPEGPRLRSRAGQAATPALRTPTTWAGAALGSR